MKKTAVEWLAQELYEKFEMKGDGKVFDELLDQAKEMEKEQMIAAHNIGRNDKHNDFSRDAEQYYNETYKQD